MYANGYGHGRVLLDLPFEPGRHAIAVSRRGGRVVVGFRGSLDQSTAPTLRETVISELAKGPELVVVDLSDVDFWDSCGMSAVLVAYKRCRANGTALGLAGLRGSAETSYRATHLDSVIPTYPDVASAVAHWAAAA
ncbi:STAS domain-containing protein [Kitasatospora sp. NBC_01539]|uniref:STAS domain-containing protein n=1 Tax=Kitasatospora sp. NBC_01539 TaxID=2903577 RepID=UPI00386016ED